MHPPQRLDLLDLLRKRQNDTYAQMAREMNQSLYADSPTPTKSRGTLRQRLRHTADRAHDAWLVLTGRADIG